MTIQKKVIIRVRRGLVEATVYNRSEVVECLKQHNWHLNRETFVCVAPDEYCLVSNKAVTADMNILNEEVVRMWSTVETAELKELREYKEWGTKAFNSLVAEMIVLCVVFAPATVFAWSHLGAFEKCIICVAWLVFLWNRLCIFASLDDPKSNK